MHDSTTLPHGRRQLIANRLRQGAPVVAAHLAVEFGVSEDAIRRDLRALAGEGLCQRVYGGALPLPALGDGLPLSAAGAPMAERMAQDAGRKRALAQAALGLIAPGMTIYLDAGSTPLQLARILPEGLGLRVVTHSIPAAAALVDRRDLSLIVIGGAVTPEIGGAVDAVALDALARIRVDLCFLGACALSVSQGLAGFDMADVAFKRRLIDQSAETVLMMTNAKIDTSAPFAIAPASAVGCFVLEADAPLQVQTALRDTGAEVRLAQKVETE